MIEYTIYSFLISEEVNVKIVLTNEDDKYITNNAFVKYVEIRNQNDDIIYRYDSPKSTNRFNLAIQFSRGTDHYFNYNLLKNKCFEFIPFISEYYFFDLFYSGRYETNPYLYDNMSDFRKQKYDEMYDKVIIKNRTEKKDSQTILFDFLNEWLSEHTNYTAARMIDIIEYYQKPTGIIGDMYKITEHLEIAEKSQKIGSVFYIPIMDKIGKMNKEEFSLYVNSEFVRKENVSYQFVIDKFIDSSSDCFSDFFYHLEEEYYSSYSKTRSADFQKSSNFYSVYLLVMSMNDIYTNGQENDYYSKYFDSNRPALIDDGIIMWEEYVHKMERLLDIFAEKFTKECFSPFGFAGMSYANSTRANIKRLYMLDNQDDFTKLLKKYIEKGTPNQFINKWIKKFGVGDSVSFHYDSEGLGVQIRLHKIPEDETGCLLADEGYGITQLIAIMLQIELSEKDTTIAVEEPEIHLHPKYQSLLADMFADAYLTMNKHFIIETHSEYLLRRLQLLVAGIETEKKLDKNDVSISYIYAKEEAEKENQPLVKNISICEDGYLDDTFGSGFFDEATKLSRKLM